jgi:hypothetical protein
MKRKRHNCFRGYFILMAFLPLMTMWSQTHITNETDLRTIGANLAGSYILDNDITLTGGEWTPIGNAGTPFTGTFDGNGKVIRNLSINQPNSDKQGMFGYATGATVKNLGLESLSVIGHNDVGAIIGRLGGSTIDKCYVTGYVEGNDHVGGIVGGTEADGTIQSTISNDYAFAMVNTRASQVGGILGTSVNTSVINCYFAGQVISPSSNTGGIVSLIDGGSGSSIIGCLCLAQNIKGGQVQRILGNDGGRTGILTELANYSYVNTLLNGTILATTNSQYGENGEQGANYTLAQLSVQKNYEYLGFDFGTYWKLGATGFPVFKNQTLPLNLDMIVEMPATSVLATGNTLQLSAASIVPGKIVSYRSSDATIATVNNLGVVTAIAGGNVTITAYTATDGFSNATTKDCALVVKAVNSNISTADDLNSIRLKLDGIYTLMNDIDLSGTAYATWEPIVGFTGTLNGNGHIIKNFNINKPSNDNVGFFSTVTGATISKLGIEGASVIGGTTSGSGSNVGVLIGNAIGITLSESYVANSTVFGRDHVGVIIGQTAVQDGVAASTITDCYATGTMTDNTNQGGGIVGLAEATTIQNCYFSGAIDGPANVGGITALAEQGNVTISNCIALSPYLKAQNPGRIISVVGANATLTLVNNYARTDMKSIYGSIVSVWDPTDPNVAANMSFGANVDFTQTKVQDFYQTTLGWDFNSKWKLIPKDDANDKGIYPVLKWQTENISASLIGVPTASQRIAIGQGVNVEAYGSYGQDVVYSSDNTAVIGVQSTNGIGTFTGISAGIANGIAQSTSKTYMTSSTGSFGFTVFDPNYFIEVSTPDQLNNMRNDLQSNYKLTADIDLTGYNFLPVGTDNNSPFIGRFLGNGHIISNLTINNSGSTHQGLFGFTANADIENLGLVNVNIIGAQSVGGLIGECVGTTIHNVYVTGYIEGVDHVGGIIGGTDNGTLTTIKDSYANANVVTRASQVGGILGDAQSTDIERVYFTGTVNAPLGNQGNNSGGIIGLTENGLVSLNGVASLATVVNGGTTSEFVARGNALSSATNIYTRSDMVLSANASSDGGLGRSTVDQQKSLSVFQNSTIYQTTMGWDFSTIWQIINGNFPTFKPFITAIIPVLDSNKPVVYSGNGSINVDVKGTATVQVFDVMGRSLKTVISTGSIVSLPLPQGVFIVRVVSEGTTTTTKVINAK